MKRHRPAGRPLDAVATALMVVLCLSWGLNQVAIKLALPEIPPMMQGALRSFGALPLVFIVAQLRGVRLTARDGTLAAGLIVGALFGLEFICIYAGLVWTTASRGVVFLYTAPFCIALGARLFLHERLAPLQWGGLALAFLGIVVAVGVPDPTVDGRILLGDAFLIGGGVLWATTTLIIKGTSLARVPAEKTTIYQLAMSALLLTVGAAVLGERVTRMPGAVALGSLAYQTIWVLAITFTVWFALVVKYSASRLAALSFLTPLFGVAAGHFIMGDPLTPTFALAVVLVVAGLVLVNRPR
jgi:drug/metabolite transporter (DMT)-like permease